MAHGIGEAGDIGAGADDPVGREPCMHQLVGIVGHLIGGDVHLRQRSDRAGVAPTVLLGNIRDNTDDLVSGIATHLNLTAERILTVRHVVPEKGLIHDSYLLRAGAIGIAKHAAAQETHLQGCEDLRRAVDEVGETAISSDRPAGDALNVGVEGSLIRKSQDYGCGFDAGNLADAVESFRGRGESLRLWFCSGHLEAKVKRS